MDIHPRAQYILSGSAFVIYCSILLYTLHVDLPLLYTAFVTYLFVFLCILLYMHTQVIYDHPSMQRTLADPQYICHIELLLTSASFCLLMRHGYLFRTIWCSDPCRDILVRICKQLTSFQMTCFLPCTFQSW